jgi:hypothetical protein
MSFTKGVAFWAYYTAWDAPNNVGRTGDKANHTVSVSRNGAAADTATNNGHASNHVELANGEYAILLTAVEAATDSLNVFGASTTTGVVLIPFRITLLDALVLPDPSAAEGIKKNEPFPYFKFTVVLASDHRTPAVDRILEAQRLIDDGVFEATDNPVVELGQGIYLLSLTAEDLNGEVITLHISGPGVDPRVFEIKTSP